MTTKQERIDALATKIQEVVEAYIARSLEPLAEKTKQMEAEAMFQEQKIKALEEQFAAFEPKHIRRIV